MPQPGFAEERGDGVVALERFEIEKLFLDDVVHCFDVGLEVFPSRGNEAMARADSILDGMGEAAIAFAFALGPREFRSVVGLDDGRAPGIEAVAFEVRADGGDEPTGVGLGQFAGKAQKHAAGFGIAIGVFKPRQPGGAEPCSTAYRTSARRCSYFMDLSVDLAIRA